MIWTDVLNTALSLAVGLLTGFFFERRNTKATRIRNVELEHALQRMQNAIDDARRSPDIPPSAPLPSDDSFIDRVLGQARQIQDADGRINRFNLRYHLRDYRPQDVDDAIKALCAGGHLYDHGKWLEVR